MVSTTIIDPLGMFNVEKPIAKGGFGEILKANGEDKREYVVKSIPKTKKQAENIEREVQAGLRLVHPNLVNFTTQFHDEEHDYLVFEYVKGLDMFKFMEQRKLKPLKEKEARKIMIQLFKAVQYSHSRNVVHLDIKLDNIMIEPKSGHVTLIDFGLCDFITEQNSGFIKRRVGSKEYCAAELLTSPSESYDATKVDVWCLGVVLYTLISSKFPFNPKKRKESLQKGEPHPIAKFQFKISEKAKDLLEKMLCPNPANRITLTEVLAHPWITK